jgi:hypothetical protein
LPNPYNLVGEPAQSLTVAPNAIVGEVAPHHCRQVAMLDAIGRCRFFRHQSFTAANARRPLRRMIARLPPSRGK